MTVNIWFTLLTMNTAEQHFSIETGRASEFNGSLVNSALILAIAAGQSVIDTSFNAMANLGWDEVRLTHPVFVGDTLFRRTFLVYRRGHGRPTTFPAPKTPPHE